MITVTFEKLPLCKSKGQKQYYWFSAEYSIDGQVRLGEGCAFSDSKRVEEIKAKFEAFKTGANS